MKDHHKEVLKGKLERLIYLSYQLKLILWKINLKIKLINNFFHPPHSLIPSMVISSSLEKIEIGRRLMDVMVSRKISHLSVSISVSWGPVGIKEQALLWNFKMELNLRRNWNLAHNQNINRPLLILLGPVLTWTPSLVNQVQN